MSKIYQLDLSKGGCFVSVSGVMTLM